MERAKNRQFACVLRVKASEPSAVNDEKQVWGIATSLPIALHAVVEDIETHRHIGQIEKIEPLCVLCSYV